MLREIKIKNFKSISTEQTLHSLGNINILAGENNSGKTAILEIIWLLGEVFQINNVSISDLLRNAININTYIDTIRKLNSKTLIEDFFYNKRLANPIEIKLTFDMGTQQLADFFKKHAYDEGVNRPSQGIGNLDTLSINIIIAGEIVKINAIYWGKLLLTLEENPTGRFLDIPTYLNHPNHPRNFSLSVNSSFYVETFFPALQKCIESLSTFYIHSKRKIESVVHINQGEADFKGSLLKRDFFRLYHGDQTEQNKYERILELFFKITNKKIFHKPSYNKTQHTTEIIFEEGDTFIDIDSSGYGYYQLLNILYNIVIYKSNIILIDEPEISLHPQAQIKFYDAIKEISQKENKQFFIATHSPYFIDLRSISNVYKSTKIDNHTIIRQITNPELLTNLVSKNDRIFSFRFRELFFVNEVIFVEGFDDLDFYIKFIEEEAIPIAKPLEKFYEIGGYRQERINMLSSFCKEFDIKYSFLLDFDYLLYSPQINRLIDALKEIKSASKLLLKMQEFSTASSRDRKRIKPQIAELWQKQCVQCWREKSIMDLINEEIKNNILIIPGFDINLLEEDIKQGNSDLKTLLVELLKSNLSAEPSIS